MSNAPNSADPFDCSIILTVHRERHLLTRTLASLEASAVYAREFGHRCELVVVLDRADALTSTIARSFTSLGFQAVIHIATDHGSLGPSRNSGISVARGRYVATADADDLVSINILSEMIAAARSSDANTLLFPELLIGFGTQYFVGQYFSMDDEIRLSFLAGHPYVSRVFGPRSYFVENPYIDVRLSTGYAYEDWHFNAEAVARRMRLNVVRNTALFYRKRPGSLLSQADQRSIRQTPPTQLFRPDVFLDVMAGAYETYRSTGGRRTERKQVLTPLSQNPVFLESILAANEIEPAIYPPLIDQGSYFTSLEWANIGVGAAYYELCRLIGPARFTDIFLFPFVRHGGAEKYIADIMSALLERDPKRRILVLLGERDTNLNVEILPPECEVVDFHTLWPELEDQWIDLVTLRLIEAYEGATIHLRQSVYAERFFRKYCPVLGGRKTFFYRFCDDSGYFQGEPISAPWGFSFIDEHIDDLVGVITDNGSIVDADVARLGAHRDKYAVIYARQGLQPSRRNGAGRRVLWASRLVAQKRPGMVLAIADALEARKSDIVIDARGEAPDFDVSQLAGKPNLIYGGPFDRFAHVVNAEHFGFLYTSQFDGLPNVLLEAAAHGLPVIAPDVGGISEFIIHGETGILLQSDADDAALAAAYADALIGLRDDVERQDALSGAAQERLRLNHAPETHLGRVVTVFGLGEAWNGQVAAQ